MSDTADNRGQQIPCLRCRHFQITWQADFPRSCRAMGFKTKGWPFQEVLQSSGKPCLVFEEKRPLADKPTKTESKPQENPDGSAGFSRIV